MNDRSSPERLKAERIAQARADLRAAYKANPEAVQSFEARMQRLQAAQRRERERVDLLVLGKDRPAPIATASKRGGKRRIVKTAVKLDPGVERMLSQREDWSHKQGTPETLAAYERAHEGSLAQLRENGTIDAGQLAYAEQIRGAAEALASDVAVGIVSYEPRIATTQRGPSEQILEGLSDARRSVAYSLWRERIPDPRSAVLDMLTGPVVGYTVAATRHRMGHRKAKRLLLTAIDIWPTCMDEAVATVSRSTLNDLHRRAAE